MFRNFFKNQNTFFRIVWFLAILSAITSVAVLTRKCTLKSFVYPLPHKETVLSASTENGLNSALVYAVIKTESNFNPKAISDKGAKGLMQITDKTAEYIAKMKKLESYDLFDEKTNIEFGCYYLAYLKNKFGSERLAVIAYNAGEGNLNRWLNNPEYSDDRKNLKNIPFPETREYVKKVEKTFEKYKKLYVHILDKYFFLE